MSEQYRYNCVDESVLLPILKKHVFIPLHRWIPYGVPANYLTLVSIVMMWGIFLYFTTLELPSPAEIGAAVLVITAYVIFDHFDGLQAKLTQTSSPLGEWLDHFSDVFNGAIVVYLGFKCLHLPLDGLFLVLTWLNFVAFAATYVEQRVRRELYFGKIGSLEGVVLMIAVLALCVPESGRALWHLELGWPIYQFLLASFALGCFGTVITCLQRMRALPREFLVFSIGGSLLVLLGIYLELSTSWLFCAITIFSSEFILRNMQQHLTSQESVTVDLVVFGLLAGLVGFHWLSWNPIPLLMLFSLGLGLSMLLRCRRLLTLWRPYWVWWNPSTPS
jgi:phosphatidylglycerophosphate synthase